MDEQKNHQQQTTLQETAEEKRIRYLTDEERREWSGLSEWRDPLEKEKTEPDENDGKFALAAVLCGIVSVLFACFHISSMLFGAAAIICGVISKKKPETTHTMATVGIVLGCICFGIALVLKILWIMGRLFPPEAVSTIPSDLTGI